MNINPFYPQVPLISVELTNYCNLRCPYCGNRNMTRPRGYMQWELLEKIVAESSQAGYDIECLHGAGEPLLYPRLEEAIRLVKNHNAGKASISTNGVLLFPDKARKLLDAGLDIINVSLDSLDPEIYANTRGADLAKVVENIQHLIRLAPSTVNIDISLMNSNVQAVSEKESRLFHETFGTHENVKLHRVENGLFPLADADFRVNPSKTGSCFTTACYLPVMWDGRVALCCLDQDVQHPLGNLNENSISEVWYNKTNQGILFKLALGEPGCPDYCVQHCVMTIDPAVHELSDSEIRVWRAQKLLQIANTISEEYKYFGLDPEFFIQRARDIAPSDLQLGKKEEDDCQQSYQANSTGNDQVRSENFLKTSFAFLVRKLSK